MIDQVASLPAQSADLEGFISETPMLLTCDCHHFPPLQATRASHVQCPVAPAGVNDCPQRHEERARCHGDRNHLHELRVLGAEG